MSTKALIDKLIRVAEDQVGYLEKKSNKDLDDKTNNAGSNNYTKYNRDLLKWTGVGSINAQWCQAFVDWCFIEAFGKADAKKLIYVWTNYTPTGSDAFKKRGRYIKRGEAISAMAKSSRPDGRDGTSQIKDLGRATVGKPKRGDVIYFYSKAKGRIGHVGIVYKVSGSTVYTIEGNTSGASSLVTNGGGVRKKSYSLSSTYIDGYGSVDYSAIEGGDPEGLRRGDMGEDVRAMQRALMLWCSECLPKYGADGDFGEETEKALKDFQKSVGLPDTGVYDAATKKALQALPAGSPAFPSGEGGAQAPEEVPAGSPAFPSGEGGAQAPEEVPAGSPGTLSTVVIITGGNVNVRSAPGTASRILGVVHAGDTLPYQDVTQTHDGREWYLVEYDRQNGWVSSKYAKVTE